MNSEFSAVTRRELRTEPMRLVRSCPKRGFSILELMIALLVLLFGFIAMMNLIAASIVVNRSSNRLTALTQLASDKLEELRSLDISDPRAQAGGSLTADETQNVGGQTVSYFDTVLMDQRSGSIVRTAGPDQNGTYDSVTRTIGGVTSETTSGSEPTQVSYRRRWLIESDQPIAAATRITVEVAVKTNKLSEADPSIAAAGFHQVIRMCAVR